jgi:S1-C subfamily serine protease
VYIYPNGTKYAPDNRTKCEVLYTAKKEEIDLASLQTANHTLPTYARIVPLSNIDSSDYQTPVGTVAYIIGFPYGDELAKDEQHQLNCSITQGSFTQAPSTSYIQYSAASASGASGSPVFNQNGRLVAVNYMSFGTGQNFNRGILAKYIKGLR